MLDFELDLPLTLALHRRGPRDPTMTLTEHESVRATRTPDGPATLRLALSEDALEAEAWGPGAECIVDDVPRLIGAGDDPRALVTDDPVVRDLARRLRGLRIGRTERVIEALVPAIIEQKVTTVEAHRGYADMCFAWGEPAPGPYRLRVPPSPEVLTSKPYYEYHRFNIPRRKAEVIRAVCSRADKLEEIATMDTRAAEKRMRYFSGVGAWTAAEVGARALGDPDVVSVGDFHLPHQVAWALAGERRADDARMLDLLEPFRGQRQRVIRLIEAGAPLPPRRAPRARVRAIGAI